MENVAILVSKTILYAVPLLLGALGAMFSERSGIINIAIEGIMVFGSLFGALFITGAIADSTFAENYPQLVVFVAMFISGITGLVFSLLLGYASIKLKADQVITGTALNIFAPAFVILVAYAVVQIGVSRITLPDFINLSAESFGIDSTTIPDWVDILLFRNLYLTTFIAIIILVISYVALYKTRFGLRLRACGEHPQAADSVGINVIRMRYTGVAISGFLAGLAGFSFAIANGGVHSSDVLGYGFLAIAVMIFGNWKPFRILFAALFFSFFKIIAVFATTLETASGDNLLPTFGLVSDAVDNMYKMIPYIITLVALAFTSKNSR
ncbi:MAG: ABC transporter permease, partial [Sphaerochaetaceae bacterium]|nr:ABC transporter permease [Sphaerochaetaceae bacterium]